MDDWLIESLRNFEWEDEDFEPIYITNWTGKKHTEESKKAIGDANRGRPCPEHQKDLLREYYTGRKMTPEWQARKLASYCENNLYSINKGKKKEVVSNLNAWCKENNLPRTSVCRHLENGTSYKGYTFSREVVK